MKIFPVSRYRIKNHAGELLFPTVRQYTTKLPKREDLSAISKIAKIHKKIKKDMAHLVVTPIGEEPDGLNFSGFTALDEKGKGYALLFRDCTNKSTHTFKKVLSKGAELEYMYSNSTPERPRLCLSF